MNNPTYIKDEHFKACYKTMEVKPLSREAAPWLYLQLMDHGTQRKKAMNFAKKLPCKEDITILRQGPPKHRILKANMNKVISYKGWKIGGEIQYINNPQFKTSIKNVIEHCQVDNDIDKSMKHMDKILDNDIDKNIQYYYDTLVEDCPIQGKYNIQQVKQLQKKLENNYLHPKQYIEDKNVKLFEVVKEYVSNKSQTTNNYNNNSSINHIESYNQNNSQFSSPAQNIPNNKSYNSSIFKSNTNNNININQRQSENNNNNIKYNSDMTSTKNPITELQGFYTLSDMVNKREIKSGFTQNIKDLQFLKGNADWKKKLRRKRLKNEKTFKEQQIDLENEQSSKNYQDQYNKKNINQQKKQSFQKSSSQKNSRISIQTQSLDQQLQQQQDIILTTKQQSNRTSLNSNNSTNNNISSSSNSKKITLKIDNNDNCYYDDSIVQKNKAKKRQIFQQYQHNKRHSKTIIQNLNKQNQQFTDQLNDYAQTTLRKTFISPNLQLQNNNNTNIINTHNIDTLYQKRQQLLTPKKNSYYSPSQSFNNNNNTLSSFNRSPPCNNNIRTNNFYNTFHLALNNNNNSNNNSCFSNSNKINKNNNYNNNNSSYNCSQYPLNTEETEDTKRDNLEY